MKHQVVTDPNLSADLNFVSTQPTVVRIRMWVTPSGGTTQVFDLSSPKGTPVHQTIPAMASGGAVDYWVGVHGSPGRPYRVIASLSQNGKLVANGTFVSEGILTSGGGVGIDENEYDYV